MRKISFISVFLLLLAIQFAHAAYFRFLPFRVMQPDGTEIACYVSGDEFFNWLHDKDGYTIIQADDGYYYYGQVSGNIVVPSSYLAGQVDPEKAGLTKWAKISLKEYQSRKDEFFRYEEKSVQAPHSGTLNNLVIYIRFQDDPEFTVPRQTFDNKFNPETGNTLKSYYTEVSYNSLVISSTHYPDCPMSTNLSYQDSHNRNYFQPFNATTNPGGYVDGDQRRVREHTLLKDAITWINTNSPVPAGLNIDGDNDGKVDNVCFIIEGSNGAWADLLWAHRWFLTSYDVFINGKKVFDYTFQPQTQVNVQTLCHEMFHALGAPDLYHYSYDGLTPAGAWDLMESGDGHMGAYMKYKYTNATWITSMPEITKSGKYWLQPLSSSVNNCFKIASPNSTDEFFVVEYRRKSGLLEGTLPGSGLLVYRIDPNETGNAGGPPDEVYIFRPNGTISKNGNPSIAFFSSESGRTAINNETNPAPFLQNGSSGGLDIRMIGSASDSISFVVNLSSIPEPDSVTATTMSTSRIDLKWNKNDSGDPVMIAYSLSPGIYFPEDGIEYTAGSQIPGGGTVIYLGNDPVFLHTGLNTNTTYYYTVWSVNPSTRYSPGAYVSATTFCEAINGLPFTEDFESNSKNLTCWTQEKSDPKWIFIEGNGPNPGAGFPSSSHSGIRNALLKDLSDAGNENFLFSPVLNLKGSFEVTLKFWIYMRSWSGKQDELSVWYRNSNEEEWKLLEAYSNSISQWTEETLSIPEVSSQFQLAFKGNAKHGFGICLDDIALTGNSIYNLEIAPTVLEVSPAAGSENVSLTSNTDWVASSDASWCTVTPSGNGSKEVILDFLENTDSEARFANITITAEGLTPRTVTLNQRGRGVSIREDDHHTVMIFPNPSKGMCTIQSERFSGKSLTVTLMDLTGYEIRSFSFKGGKEVSLDLREYPQGFYLLRIKAGSDVTVHRLVISK